jgi:hypothetical protein
MQITQIFTLHLLSLFSLFIPLYPFFIPCTLHLVPFTLHLFSPSPQKKIAYIKLFFYLCRVIYKSNEYCSIIQSEFFDSDRHSAARRQTLPCGG